MGALRTRWLHLHRRPPGVFLDEPGRGHRRALATPQVRSPTRESATRPFRQQVPNVRQNSAVAPPPPGYLEIGAHYLSEGGWARLALGEDIYRGGISVRPEVMGGKLWQTRPLPPRAGRPNPPPAPRLPDGRRAPVRNTGWPPGFRLSHKPPSAGSLPFATCLGPVAAVASSWPAARRFDKARMFLFCL